MQSALRSTPLTLRQLSRSTVKLDRQAVVANRHLHVQVPVALTLVANKQFKTNNWMQTRYYADKVVKVPQMAESISEGTLKQWVKSVGDFVRQDEEVATIETDKIDVTVNAPAPGTIVEVYAQEEDNVSVGAAFFKLELGDEPTEGADSSSPKQEEFSESNEKEDAPSKNEKESSPAPAPAATELTPPPTLTEKKPAATSEPPAQPQQEKAFGNRSETRVKMSRMRLRIAERLKQSQDTAASLTTFNEVDMSNLMSLRAEYKDAVVKKHGIKFGFMSAFVKASACALTDFPAVNASIDGNEIVYHDYVDLSVAVSTPKGLVTPVLRNVENLDLLGIESNVAALGKKARDGKITIEDMAGGTFTISNGGVFGSLMGTPIINLPQTAILGMHGIKERPVAINGKVEIRPMMYIALTYDHRLVDGREAVQFLVRIKELVEDPRRLLLNI